MPNTRIESFVKHGSRYGVWSMVSIFFQLLFLKYGITSYIKMRKYGKIFLRTNTSDLPTFRQIFLDEEYRTNLFNAQTIVDLGSNIGLSARYFSTHAPNAKIICFEPDLENFNQLQKNINGYKNISAFRKAIWSSIGEIYLSADESLGEWGVQVSQIESKNKVSTTTVPQIMLDNNLTTIDVLKIDIETAEEEIFKNAEWLSQVKLMIIETHDRFKKASSNNFIRSISKLEEFNIEVCGENIIVKNLAHFQTITLKMK